MRLTSRLLAVSAVVVAAAGSALVAAPAASAATPTVTGGSAIGVGASSFASFTVTGTGFAPGATVSFSAPQALTAQLNPATLPTVTAGSEVVSADGTKITATVSLASSATTGKVDVSVTQGGTAVSCFTGNALTAAVSDTGCVTTEAAPSSITIAAVGAGAVGHATTITATGLVAGQGQLIPANGVGIAAGAFTIAGGSSSTASSTATAPVTVATSVAAGNQTVTLVNGDGGRATATLPVDAAPTVTSLTNTDGVATKTLAEDITGTGFVNPTVTFLGTSCTVPGGTTETSTSVPGVQCPAIPSSTTGGPQPLLVQNPGDGGTGFININVHGLPAAPQSIQVVGTGDGTATLSWLPITGAATNNSTVSYYLVGTNPQTPGRIIPATDTPQITLTGLTDGTTYTAGIAAITSDNVYGAIGSSASFTPVAPAVPVVPSPQVTFKASKTSLNFADSVVFSGTVLNPDGTPDASDQVFLQTVDAKGKRADTGDFASTDANGNFTFDKQTPAYTASYGLRVGTYSTGNVQVKVAEYLHLATIKLSKTRVLTITGVATPSTTAYNKVTVEIFKVTKTGHRVGVVAKGHLQKVATKKGYQLKVNNFTLTSTLKKGNYTLAVAILGTPTNAPVQSKPFTLKVS